MIIIYDFDGTLTPYGLPQYDILKRIGYDDGKLINRVMSVVNEKSISLYEAFYKTYEDILGENNLEMSYSNIVFGAENVEFNDGVLSYFESIHENKDVKNFIVTSGFEDYVRSTKIAPFVDGIYGVTYKRDGDIYTKIDRIVTVQEKIAVIKKIIDSNRDCNIIYVGDGLTDKYAFLYVHSIGGVSIFVGSNDKDFENFKTLKNEGIVDEYFVRDYSQYSKLREYIDKVIKERRE